MPTVCFTPNLLRHVKAGTADVSGNTVRQALLQSFAENPGLQGYILDEHERLRKHIAVFVNGRMVRDRILLSDEVEADSEIFVMQALSGG